MERRLSARWLVLSGMLVMVAAGCHTTTPGPYSSTQQPQLPEKVPDPPNIVFTGAGEEWPPRPRERTEVTIVPTEGRAGAFTEALEPQLRSAALADARVRSALGERFSYIVAAEVDPDKNRQPRAAEPLRVRLTFYSYSNNVAVQVFMSGQAVESVRRREDYQPPEGPEEMETAIAMARRDERLREVVQGLNVTAILTERQRDQAGYGHRVLHVSFSDPGADAPRYYALVDLTASTILTAGPVAGY